MRLSQGSTENCSETLKNSEHTRRDGERVAIWRLRWCGSVWANWIPKIGDACIELVMDWYVEAQRKRSRYAKIGPDYSLYGPTCSVLNQVKWNAALSGLERYEMLLSQGSTELKWSVLTKKIMCINVNNNNNTSYYLSIFFRNIR